MSGDRMEVRLLTGAPGCGKTTRIRNEAIQNERLSLYAYPTIPLVEEQAKAFRSEAENVDVQVVHSRSNGRGSVSKRLGEATSAVEAKGSRRSVILTTHSALLSPNIPDLAGWHVCIDEAIDAVRSGTITRSLEQDLFAANFTLDPVGSTGWSELRRLHDGPGWQAIQRDTLANSVLDFLKLAFSDAQVFVRAVDWRSARSIDWLSIWCPTSLKDAASVTLAGAAFESSLGFKVWDAGFHDQITFQKEVMRPLRRGSPTLRIQYFTKAHEGTTTFWETSAGRLCLHKIATFLTAQAPKLGYWSGNTVATNYLEHRVPGVLAKPKAAGLNCYRDHTSCGLFFSSKPLQGDRPVQEVFGITDEQLLAAREEEDIAQFVFRGAIRDPEFDGTYEVYLYSERQARCLRDRLIRDGVVTEAEVLPLDAAGIMDLGRQAATLPELPRTADEKRAKDAERKRLQRAARAKAEGRVPCGPGRPKIGRR